MKSALLAAFLTFAGTVSAGEVSCPHWISVMPLAAETLVATADDVADLGARTIVDGVAYCCPVHPEGNPVIDKAGPLVRLFSEIAPTVRKRSGIRQGVLLQSTMGHGGPPAVRAPWQLAVPGDGRWTPVAFRKGAGNVCTLETDVRTLRPAIFRLSAPAR